MNRNHLGLCLLIALLGVSCRTTRNDSETAGVLGGSKAPEKKMCVETNTPLPGTPYSLSVFPKLDEEWPICKSAEQKEFADFGKRMHALQTQLGDHNRKFTFRGFHAKSHGCMYGYFTTNNPATRNTRQRYAALREFAGDGEPTAYGLFAQEDRHEVYIRFSNAQGKFQNDRSPDGKGIAIKILNVPNSQTGSQDFTMSNTPICNAATADEFMVLGHSLANGIGEVAKLLAKPVERRAIIGTLTSGGEWKPSVATENYWTRTAYKMGPYAAKYFVMAAPCKGQSAETHGKPKLSFQKLNEYLKYQKDLTKMEDYYRDELVARNENGDICFDFMVQFQTDPEKTPVENPTIEWTNDLSPGIKVGTIVIPAKQAFNSPAANQFCERLGFSPENFIEAHRPMSHMNRARLAVYKASRDFRQKQYQVPPEPKTVNDLVK